MSKRRPLGSLGKRRRNTRTMNKRWRNYAPASAKRWLSPKGAEGRKVSFSWAPDKVIGGEDYLLQMTIPNVYFHIAMAYAVLRQGGVDIGKMDFLGPINLVKA
jgi:hypothetical protein